MAILKTDILTFVNRALQRSETDIDIEIQLALNDLSNEDFLEAEDTDQTLASGDLTLDYPTDYRDLVSIVLINSSSVRGDDLIALPQGFKQYQNLRSNDSTTDSPEYYAEFERKFHLWRPPGGYFTTEIKYYRFHPQTVGNIIFPDEFRNCIYYGAAYFRALTFGLTRLINIWGPQYFSEKGQRTWDNLGVARITQ